MNGLTFHEQQQMRELKAKERAFKRKLREARPQRTHEPIKPTRGRQVDDAYRGWIRQLPCAAGLVRGDCPAGHHNPVEAAHVRFSDARVGWDTPGMQRKPSDDRCVPLCRHHHQHEQHRQNERAWWDELGIWPPDLCAALVDAYPDLERGRLVLHEFAVGHK